MVRKTESTKTVIVKARTQKYALSKARMENPGWTPILTQVRTKYTVYDIPMRKKDLRS